MNQTVQPLNDMDFIRFVLKSQYHGALAMLRQSVELCPENLWTHSEHRNAFWQVAYHALYFTHLYLQPNESSFRPWDQHQTDVQNPDGIAAPPDPKSTLPLIPEQYSKAQVLSYCDFCDGIVDNAVEALDLRSADCGFHWYKVSKLEHQFVNIRHIQHHTGQLADRLRDAADLSVPWVASG
jgi:hypothetical protein